VTVTIDGKQTEMLFDSADMNHTAPGGVELPIEFSISIKAVRQNRFAIAAQNELMLNLLHLGAIPMEQAIELMEFEGKEQVLKHLNDTQGAETLPAEPKKKEKQHAV